MADSERGLFFTMQRQNVYMRRFCIACLAVTALVMTYAFFSMAVRKDKVVLLDSTGQPRLLDVQDDQVFKSEAAFFIRKVLEQTFTIHYGIVANTSEWERHMGRIKPFYNSGFFKIFIRGLKDAGFFQSIADNKLILTPSLNAIRDIQKMGDDKIVAIIELETSSTGREGAITAYSKTYEIRLQRRSRMLENPWGLYVCFLSEKG